ncbi:MAG: translation elongation factor Ts [Candidatus Peribacteraceae bacterium]|nr:translation elongation factor Ts [Candidatus Peribacteraceae bacterium]
MSPVSASDVATLRARTGVSMMACKEALDEAGGDMDKAIEILRKRGLAQAVKKADRAQNAGALFIAQGKDKAAVVSLKCETDFVARNDDFTAIGEKLAASVLANGLDAGKKEAEAAIPAAVQKLGENITVGETQEVAAPVVGSYVHSNKRIAVVVGLDKGTPEAAKDAAMHAAAMSPSYVYPEDVPEDALVKEREIWKAQLKNEKKPEAIWDKIMVGKERKFREENALAKQVFVKDNTKTVEQYLDGAKITAYVRVVI